MNYLDGRVLRVNAEKAAYWLARAAEQGYVDAQYELGCLYFRGVGVRKDVTRARALWGKAADKKHTAAIGALRDLEQ
jgi:TPR repeat protein